MPLQVFGRESAYAFERVPLRGRERLEVFRGGVVDFNVLSDHCQVGSLDYVHNLLASLGLEPIIVLAWHVQGEFFLVRAWSSCFRHSSAVIDHDRPPYIRALDVVDGSVRDGQDSLLCPSPLIYLLKFAGEQ